MPQNNIQVNYDELKNMAVHFGLAAENHTALLTATRQLTTELHINWAGRGASAFFSEMDGQILPAYERLIRALDESRAALVSITTVFKQAEEESAQYFKG
jgi:WXG100 family type VII secretion target